MERRNSIKRKNTGIFSSYQDKVPTFFLNRNAGMANINSRRGNIPLTFIPPSTKSPLFVYNNDFDKRSFLSLCSPSHADDEEQNAISEVASVSTSRSLPSSLNITNDDLESIRTWLDEERERISLVSGDQESISYTSINSHDILEEADRLFKNNSYSSSTKNDQEFQEEDFAKEVTTTSHEFNKLVRYSVPLILTFFLEQVFSLVCVVFVGHLGKAELAAVSMASMTSTIVLAIFEGISTALDTLCPQAYGAGQYSQVGIHFQRCSLFSLTLFIPAAFFWFYSGSILKHVINDTKVVNLTQLFLRILILGGPPYILFENGKRFLQAQGIFEAGTIILLITAPVNVFLNWLLVYSESSGLGYIGAPIASVINFWLMLILMVLYVIFIDGSECWDGFSKEALTHWHDLSLLAIPGIIMLLAESLAYEVLTLLASYFGTSALATQSALSSVVSLLYMIPFAVSVASSTRIANFIGSANIHSSKVATNVGLCSSLIVAISNASVLLFGSKIIAKLFTDDDEIISMIVGLCPLIAVFTLIDALTCVASGILRALALQAVGGTISLIGYYVIAVPLAFFLSFNMDMELVGLWLGNGSGLLVIGLAELYVIFCANWDNIVEEARKRNSKGDEEEHVSS